MCVCVFMYNIINILVKLKVLGEMLMCGYLMFQCLWRCYAAEPRSNFQATWRIHIQENPHRHHGPNAFTKAARRASVNIKKRRFSKGRFELSGHSNHIADRDRKDSEASVMFMSEDNRGHSGTVNRSFETCPQIREKITLMTCSGWRTI